MHYDYSTTDDDDETFELHSLKRLTRTSRPCHHRRHHHHHFDLKIGSQTSFYTCRFTSYYYTHGIIVAVKNTLSLFVYFFANPL